MQEPLTKKERIIGIIIISIAALVMVGIFYLIGTSPPADNSDMMMEMFP
jgi:hypothetical protein